MPGTGITEQYVLAANLSFEVDIWGKLRRSTEAARAELLATEEVRRTVLISLIADVASAYLLLLDQAAQLLEIDDRGAALQRGLPPGDYTVRAFPADLVFEPESFRITAGETVTLSAPFRPSFAVAGRGVREAAVRSAARSGSRAPSRPKQKGPS